MIIRNRTYIYIMVCYYVFATLVAIINQSSSIFVHSARYLETIRGHFLLSQPLFHCVWFSSTSFPFRFANEIRLHRPFIPENPWNRFRFFSLKQKWYISSDRVDDTVILFSWHFIAFVFFTFPSRDIHSSGKKHHKINLTEEKHLLNGHIGLVLHNVFDIFLDACVSVGSFTKRFSVKDILAIAEIWCCYHILMAFVISGLFFYLLQILHMLENVRKKFPFTFVTFLGKILRIYFNEKKQTQNCNHIPKYAEFSTWTFKETRKLKFIYFQKTSFKFF